jgi:hypothetical protein
MPHPSHYVNLHLAVALSSLGLQFIPVARPRLGGIKPFPFLNMPANLLSGTLIDAQASLILQHSPPTGGLVRWAIGMRHRFRSMCSDQVHPTAPYIWLGGKAGAYR